MRVLIVDDIAENRYLLEAILKGNGYEVESEVNGVEAMERLKAGGYDLIISDILMPVMDGFQLCRKVKTDEALRHIPFIVYTATYTGPQDEAFAIKIGADRFIQKPCEPDIFIEVVQEVMAAAHHRDIGPLPESETEEEILKLYNERLVRKLEQKMLELEKEIQTKRETEEKLHRANAFLDSIVENIPNMIFLKDARELRFVRLNRAGEDLLGYARDDLIGKNDYDIFPKGQADFFTENDREVLRRKKILDISEELLLTRNKEERIVHTKKVPILDEEGEPEYLLGISEDITEIKRAEVERNKLADQLLQAQKLESIGTLAGGIAHDFNNILSSVIGFTEIALYDVEKGSDIEDSLREVYNAGKRAKDLVKQILTFARQADEEIRPVKAKPAVKEVLNFLRSSIPTTIEIKQNITSDASIMGNPTQLHQIIMNLCTNAAYAMEEEGGTLEVGLEDIVIDENHKGREQGLKPGRYIKLTVSDTGTGISPENIGSIFEPYFTTKGPGAGTGFGLALVHGIVESFGGKIEVASELGKGSAFSIYLPIIKTTEIYRTYEMEAVPTGSERILFVDDEPSISKMGRQILERLGYSVKTLTSSAEALELFRSRPNDFDLVITDMTMPNMSGDKLAVELMKIRPDIPVMLCTGFSKKISDDSIATIGIRAVAYKPIVKADLAKTVRKVLDDQQQEQTAYLL